MKSRHAIIIAAIIGALGAIIAALIIANRTQEIRIDLIDMETGERIPGRIFIDTSETGFPGTADNPATVPLKKGNRFIRAESPGYEPTLISIDNLGSSRNIELRPIASVSGPQPIPLSLSGWQGWPENQLSVTRGENANEAVINGKVDDAAGFFSTSQNTALRGRTLVLYFTNTDNSDFSLNRMIKVIYNRQDRVLQPVAEPLVNGEYLPARDTLAGQGIEFIIPEDFDGKLGFVFYQSEVNNLKITAWYK